MLMDWKFFEETGLRDVGGLYCFYCDEDLRAGGPYITWQGASEIHLHPECAVEFSIRLLRDVHEYECRHLKGEMLVPRATKAG